MHHEVCAALKALARNPHEIRMHNVGGVVFGLLEYKVMPQLGFDGEHLTIEQVQPIEIAILATTEKIEKKANTYVVHNLLDPQRPISCCWTDKDVKHFGRMCKP